MTAPRIAVVSVLVATTSLTHCRCGGEPTETDQRKPIAIPAVTELADAHLGPDGFIVVSKRSAEATEEAIALDANGKERWRSAAVTQVLLGSTPSAPLYLVVRDGSRPALGAWRVDVLAVETGRLERSFAIEGGSGGSRTWLRGGATVYGVESATIGDRATLVAFDAQAGALLWKRDTGLELFADCSAFLPAPPVVTETSLFLFCRKHETERRYERDVCQFARADGSLTRTFPGDVVDAASGPDGSVFLLRDDSVEAVSQAGAALWKRELSGQHGARVAASEGWLSVLLRSVEDRDHPRGQLRALAASDGHELWRKESSDGGERYGLDLVASRDRVLFVSNLGPNLRILDSRGDLVFGAELKTKFVVSTELVGGFVENLSGVPVLAPGFLAFARREPGLEIHRVP